MDPLDRGPLNTTQVGRSRFGWHRCGSGEPLVLLNGDAMAMSLWPDRLLACLAERFSLILFDYPGIGRSVAGDDHSWRIPELASQVERFVLSCEQARPVHLLGFSSGGEVALQIAVRRPDWLGGVVVVAADAGGTDFIGDPDVMQRIAEAEPADLLALLFPAGQEAALGAYAAELMQRPQDMPTAESLSGQEQAWRAWLQRGVGPELAGITAPVLVLQGAQDQLVAADNARQLAAGIPGAELEIVPTAGHGVLMQEPEACGARIARFLHHHAAGRD